ncbi:IS4 family transposase [Bacillus mycoides]|uniref:Transposase IS4 family protein n=1 Tax=Bacillus mycoides TaxID=1405 RepID=A0A1D3MXE0_BACMY|nr:IS4 family transposase [Bacillus mycoides]OFD87396.1 transposase IS4 family protein [Bacillus mycoides]OFD88345.1 transposase IS4 family protein [Bacillus mycoides]OHX28463.1 transposase IS4 family protein [Bacillus mycoides]SCM90569.1 A0A073KK40 (Transposase) [Bacillus mycoides]
MKKLSNSQVFRLLAEELQHSFSPQALTELAKQTQFVQRTSKFRAQDLSSLCIGMGQDTASHSLVRLCGVLESETGILISPEGLNLRLNTKAVEFLRSLFSRLLQKQLLSTMPLHSSFSAYFRRIRILDATTFQVSDQLAAVYPGSGGSGKASGVKIQLEYDLLSGQFLHVEVGPGKQNDVNYGKKVQHTVDLQDLCIRDLGYFSLIDLDAIQQKGAYYLSRLKMNTKLFQKNEHVLTFKNGSIKKKYQYTMIDLEAIMDRLQPGECYEIPVVYIGRDYGLPARAVIYRLTPEQEAQRRKDRAYKEKKKRMTFSDRTKKLQGINVYVTNIPSEYVSNEAIHEFYSLRWQIEIIFKTWKSIFRIHHNTNIKKERLECHIYGKLIALLLSSTVMFQMRQLLLMKKQKELSEWKAMYMIHDYFRVLYQQMQHQSNQLAKSFLRLFHLIDKNGRKSHRYRKKTVFDILGIAYEQHLPK